MPFRFAVGLFSLFFIPFNSLEVAHSYEMEPVYQTGHYGPILSTAISGDGKFALTGSRYGNAILWNAKTGKKIRAFEENDDSITGLALTRDARFALIGSSDKTAVLWDTRTGKPVRSLKCPSKISCVAMTPRGDVAVLGLINNSVILWNSFDDIIAHTLNGHSDSVECVAISSDGKKVFSGSFDKTIVTWDATTGKKIRTFKSHSDAVVDIAINSDGSKALSASESEFAIFWNTKTGKIIRKLEGNESAIQSLALSNTGELALVGTERANTVLWNTKTGKKLRVLEGFKELSNSEQGHTKLISDVAFDSSGRMAITASWDTHAILWNTQTGKLQHKFKHTLNWHSAIAINSKGSQFITDSSTGMLTLWSTNPTEKPMALAEHLKIAQVGETKNLSISSDGKKMLLSSDNNTTQLLKIINQKEVECKATDHSGPVLGSSLSADASKALTSLVTKVVLWDAKTGQEIHSFENDDTDGANQVAINSTGSLALICTSKKAVLWDTTTLQEIHAFEGHTDSINCIAFNLDSKKVITGSSDHTAILWDTQIGHAVFTLKGHTKKVNDVSINDSSSKALTASEDGTIILWDLSTGKKIRTIKIDKDGLAHAKLSPDARVALVCSGVGKMGLWDMKMGKELCFLHTFESGKEWLVMTPEGLFDGSPNAHKYLAFRIQGTRELVSLNSFKNKYHVPALLSKLWHGERPISKIPITKNLPPKVTFKDGLKTGTILNSKYLSLNFDAKSRNGYPVTALQVFIDNKRYLGKKGLFEVSRPSLNQDSFSLDIELEPGEHTLQVVVDTEYSQGRSKEITITCRINEDSK